MNDSPEARAEHLKERVYITFAALAVVIALQSHADSAGHSLVTLVIVVSGSLLAAFLAHVLSHIAAHSALPDRAEFRHMLSLLGGGLAAVFLPVVFVVLAALGVWQVHGALRAASILLITQLVLISYLAIRRTRIPFWPRLAVLFGEFALGAAVLGLQVLAKG